MAWADNMSTVPEWKKLIEKPYHFETFLELRETIAKEITVQFELQNYVAKYKQAIVQDGLQLCLEQPIKQSSYDRKYALPTKAIWLMTNNNFTSFLSWDQDLIRKYVHLIFSYFSTVDPHTENINIYHAYLQRLLMVPLLCPQTNKISIAAAIQIEQINHQVIQNLFKHACKHSIVICIQTILSLDFIFPVATVNFDIKKIIIETAFSTIQSYLRKQKTEIERVENCMLLIKSYLQKAVKYILNVKAVAPGLIKDKQKVGILFKLLSQFYDVQASLGAIEFKIDKNITLELLKMKQSAFDKQINDFIALYSIIQKKFKVFPTLLTSQNDSSLQLISLQIMQLNQFFLLKVRRPDILKDWSNVYIEEVISILLNKRISIIHPHLIDWLMIVFNQIGQCSEQISILQKYKVIEKLIRMMTSNKSNSIMVNRILQFLKIIFINIQEQVILSVQKNKNVDINLISFKLFSEFFDHLPMLDAIIREFKSYNEHLFTFMVKFYKVIYNYAKNILDYFNYYSVIDICNRKKPLVLKFIQFCHNQPCFKLYDMEICKDLGNFFGEQVFQNQQPLQFKITRCLQAINVQKPKQTHQLLTVEPTIYTPAINFTTKAIINNPNIELPLTQRQDKSINKIEQALTNKTPSDIEFTHTKSQINQIQIHEANQIQAPAVKNNSEQVGSNFVSFMKKRLQQTDVNQDRKSKSRTPTKMKNDLKKAKNKWENFSQSSQKQTNKIPFNSDIQQRKANVFSTPKLQKEAPEYKLEKVNLIKVPKSKMPKTIKQRNIDSIRDNRIVKLLNDIRSIR